MTFLKVVRHVCGRAWRRLPLTEGFRASLLRLLPSHLRNPSRGFDPETVRPVAPGGNRGDCFIFAVIDWHYRFQRPQHLARELVSAGYRVFYVSSNLVSDSRPGFRVEQLDESGSLFQIFLNLRGARDVYCAVPDETQQLQLNDDVRALLDWTNSRAVVALVHHPFWAYAADAIVNVRVIYDCMDHHEGFGTFGESMIAAERALMARAELVVVSSAGLDARAARYARARLLIRNAADYAHFSQTPERVYRDPDRRRILGYYGAIAHWFDVELVKEIARRFSDCLILLVGHDQVGAARRLIRYSNVRFVGEVAYGDLPGYLHSFDVCLLPFVINDLTLATNPVKIYEYLSAGKPVVSVDLPELSAFEGLVTAASNRESFLDAIAATLAAPPDPIAIKCRKTFASNQTWAARGAQLVGAIAAWKLPEAEIPS